MTTTIVVRQPDTIVTTTVYMTIPVTKLQNVETTSLTENVTATLTKNVTKTATTIEMIIEPLIYSWAMGASVIAIVIPVILILRKN